MNSLKTVLTALGLSLALVAPHFGFCGIWELTQDAVARSRTKVSYEQVISHLQLLTTDDNIVRDPAQPTQQKDTFIIADGYIVISPESIRSFQNPEDYRKHVAPEFEYVFHKSKPEFVEDIEMTSADRKSLEKIRILIDIIPSHPFFNDGVGSWSYETFVGELQASLRAALTAAGADVSLLRPERLFNAATFDEINVHPPQIVISTQFNDDKQDAMTTFCGGNILKDEFASERQRAHFVEAALTGKHFHSAQLGAYITKHSKTKMDVIPLAWERASFEGNARPVPISAMICSDHGLEGNEGNCNGIAMRNLFHNGIFAQAVVIPFPDMQWVRNQIQADHESKWIAEYTRTITEAVIDYVNHHSDSFEH